MNEFEGEATERKEKHLGVMSIDELRHFLLDNKSAARDLAFDIYRISNSERDCEKEIKSLRKELKFIRKEKRVHIRELNQLLEDTQEVEEKILCVEKAIGANPASKNAETSGE